jgi:predicted metal-dependent hydrolase
MITKKWLKRQYRIANRDAFHSKLPKRNIDIMFCADRVMEQSLGDVWVGGESVTIRINSKIRFSPKLVLIVLLHEMVHILHDNSHKHGRVFQSTMKRIVKKYIYLY